MAAETTNPGEALSTTELAKLTYDEITTLANQLVKTPEFLSALGEGFFSRGHTYGLGLPANKENFEKAKHGYLVEYSANPIDTATTRAYLSILKTDLKSQETSSLYLGTSFIEHYDGQVDHYEGGVAIIHEHPEGHLPGVRTMGADALTRMRAEFSDLYPPPFLI